MSSSFLALLAQLGLFALSPPPQEGAHEAVSALQEEQALAARVDPARAQRTVRELVALGPRTGGTPSNERSADYLVRRFQELGLEARAVLDPETWCHEEPRWSVRARRGEEPWRELPRAWPWGFSPSSQGSAPLALEPRAGAVLLAASRPEIAPPPQGDSPGSPRPALVLVDGETTLDGSYPVVHKLRRGEAGNVPHFGLCRADGEWLREGLARGLEVEVAWEFEAKIARARPRTVIARLPGAAGGEPWKADHFLFCAHGDSDAGGPGADDNASGVATLLEIAAAWSAAARQGALPAREVRFAVWGAEIHSTRDHLETRVPGEGGILGLINYDQAGFGSGADQLNVEPDDLRANEGLVRALLGVLTDHAPRRAREEEPAAPGDFPSRWATNRSLGGTDSYVFSGSKLFQEQELPAVTVFTSAWGTPGEHPRTKGMPGESWRERERVSVDYDNYYHSAGDTPENTTDKEPWNMAWCARVGLLGARRYLASLP